MSSQPESYEGGWELIRGKVLRIARGDFAAVDELIQLSASDRVSPAAAEVAEAMGMILVRLEAHEFLLDRAHDAEHRLRELNALKDRHLGIAAHDLRNPIGAIRGMSRLLASGKLTDEQRADFLNAIVRVSDEMAQLVDDLLDVAVIESGAFELDRTTANLADLVRQSCETAGSIAERKGIHLELDAREVPDSRFDPPRMRQVVDNLLSNAIKFSPEGAIVRVTVRSIDDGIELCVADQGPGVPAEEVKELFASYQKTSVRPTAGEKSTGLGLFIVKQIVDAHGGTVKVESVVDHGSNFRVVVPV